MRTLTLELAERSYPIYIGSNLLSEPELFIPHLAGQRLAIVSNTTVAPLYMDKLCAALGEKNITKIELPDGESFKNWQTLQSIFDALLADKHDRTTTLIALGGGVVGDMTGFAAACYQRGVRFIQVPTTLLSQVDSSVGGKTGINHELGKNMIGAFYQPAAVIIDIATLSSLPKREFSAGMAEVIKYGLLGDEEFLYWLEANIESLMAQDPDSLAEAVERSCAAKARVVAADEKEANIRAILNLGHTFGHAIETEQGYGNWLHGEAVATGMLMALYMSSLLGWVSRERLQLALRLLRAANLPLVPPEAMDSAAFLRHMAVDKKAVDGQIRLVLPREGAWAEVTADYPRELLLQVLETDYTSLVAELSGD